MKEHPQTSSLERFAAGVCTGPERQQVVRHLLKGCTSCSAQLRDLLHLPGRKAPAPSPAPTPEPERPFRAETAARLLQEMAALTPEQQLAFARQRFRDGAICPLLIQLSRQAAHTDPARMLNFAKLAKVVAERVMAAPAGGPAARLADLRGEAWSQYADALRVCGRLRESERAFAAAGRRFAQGSGDLRLRAIWLRQQASLKSHQRDFERAAELAAEAAETFRSLGQREELGRSLLKQGIFTGYAGRPKEALGIVFESLPLIEADADLACQAVQATAGLSIEAGEPELGLKLLLENRPFFEKSCRPLALLRMPWLFGELEHALSLLPSAERSLLHARRGFLEAGLPYETALVSLTLAMVYFKLEKLSELAALVDEMLPIFRSLGVKRETFASLILWKRAEGKATLALLEEIAGELKRQRPRG